MVVPKSLFLLLLSAGRQFLFVPPLRQLDEEPSLGQYTGGW